MSERRLGRVWKVLFGLGWAACLAMASPHVFADAAPQPPDVIYGQLYVDVETAKLFPDQKTFADAVAKRAPAAILADYQAQKDQPGFQLLDFVEANFTLPDTSDTYVPPPGQSLAQHIETLWPVLTRSTTSVAAYDSLLPLPRSYVVPGGRFREAYYWDTYFTMLGLAQGGHWDLVGNMVENFAHELDTYGHIPNGNRSYYLSRSQPPFFSFMVELLARHDGDGAYARYLPELKREYAYWMQGAQGLARGAASRNVVRLADGSLLNRYWDERDAPRTESYLDDVTTAGQAPDRPAAEVYRDLRATAESGWDFSSRWLGDGKTLASIRTTAIVPVDLNSLMYHLELTLSRASLQAKDLRGALDYALRAARRAQAINEHLWNAGQGYYADYDWKLGKLSDQLTAAALYPLFAKAALPDRAWRTAWATRQQLLKRGGLLTTTQNTGQQWDAPNGWAPLQWIAIEGLRNYGDKQLARDIGTRFLANVQTVYDSQHKLVEKYIVDGAGTGTGGGGGEYPLQDGFGWSNGVTLKLLQRYPCTSQCTLTPTAAALQQ